MAAGGVTEAVSIQEMEQQILKQIPKLQLKIGEGAKIIVFYHTFCTCTSQMYCTWFKFPSEDSGMVSFCTFNCIQLKVLQI